MIQSASCLLNRPCPYIPSVSALCPLCMMQNVLPGSVLATVRSADTDNKHAAAHEPTYVLLRWVCALSIVVPCRYNEVQYYSWSNPGFSQNTGHFTQVVWKSTSQLGCAVQACGSGFAGWSKGTYVVCR
jgi:hypothetical protein